MSDRALHIRSDGAGDGALPKILKGKEMSVCRLKLEDFGLKEGLVKKLGVVIEEYEDMSDIELIEAFLKALRLKRAVKKEKEKVKAAYEQA